MTSKEYIVLLTTFAGNLFMYVLSSSCQRFACCMAWSYMDVDRSIRSIYAPYSTHTPQPPPHTPHNDSGIIPGFALGIVLSMAMFVVSYAKATARTAQATKRRSRVVRLREARRLLDQRGRILTLELTGMCVCGCVGAWMAGFPCLFFVNTHLPGQHDTTQAQSSLAPP